MAHDNDQDMHFVEYGTSVAQLGENDSIAKLASENQQKAQKVTDKQGRVRFHGAFTGGYSAGFYNTVGTEEGWTPKTFKSTQRDKHNEKQGFRPEDFMDAEDLEEFGIAPRGFQTSEKYSHDKPSRNNQRAAWDAVLPELSGTLDDVFKPVKMTKAVKILRLMGWKEGQGVGPRLKRRVKSVQGKNILGPALPPGLGKSADDSDGSDDYEISDTVTFAPKDLNPVDFAAKDNLYGIGYKPLHRAPEARVLTAGEQEEQRLMFGGRRGISGKAFAGADEDGDDDDIIYVKDSMSNYDRVLAEERTDSLAQHTKHHSKSHQSSRSTFASSSKILDGFALATKNDKLPSQYPLPNLPRGYIPTPPTLTASQTQPKLLGKLDGTLRRLLLGDSQTDAGLIPEAKLESESEPLLPDKKDSTPVSLERVSRFAPVVESSSTTEDMNAEEKLSLPPSRSMKPLNTQSIDFKPFSKNPEKQARYSKYLSLKQQGRRDAYNQIAPAEFTRFERDREREEFERSGSFFRSLTGVMASRFTRAKLPDDDNSKVRVRVDEQFEEFTDEKKSAVELKMFGELTRESYEWHPHRLLCKRFNVPDPYPNSQLVGLPTVEQDKISVFNYLDIQSLTQTAEERKAANIDVSREPSTKKEDLISQHKEKKTTSLVEEERPSMDLFSAVFASDDSDSDSDEEDEAPADDELVPSYAPTVQPSVKPKPNIEAEYAKPRMLASLYGEQTTSTERSSKVSLDDFKPKFVSKKQRATKDVEIELKSEVVSEGSKEISLCTPHNKEVSEKSNDNANKLISKNDSAAQPISQSPNEQLSHSEEVCERLQAGSKEEVIESPKDSNNAEEDDSEEEMAWMPALPPSLLNPPALKETGKQADTNKHKHKKHKHKDKHKKKKSKKSHNSTHR